MLPTFNHSFFFLFHSLFLFHFPICIDKEKNYILTKHQHYHPPWGGTHRGNLGTKTWLMESPASVPDSQQAAARENTTGWDLKDSPSFRSHFWKLRHTLQNILDPYRQYHELEENYLYTINKSVEATVLPKATNIFAFLSGLVYKHCKT